MPGLIQPDLVKKFHFYQKTFICATIEHLWIMHNHDGAAAVSLFKLQWSEWLWGD